MNILSQIMDTIYYWIDKLFDNNNNNEDKKMITIKSCEYDYFYVE